MSRQEVSMMRTSALANAHSVTGPADIYTGHLFLAFGGTGHTDQ